jgi:hypothetical protein
VSVEVVIEVVIEAETSVEEVIDTAGGADTIN